MLSVCYFLVSLIPMLFYLVVKLKDVVFLYVGMEMTQLICGGCRTLLMHARGATSVRCSCCHTVNLVPGINVVHYNLVIWRWIVEPFIILALIQFLVFLYFCILIWLLLNDGFQQGLRHHHHHLRLVMLLMWTAATVIRCWCTQLELHLLNVQFAISSQMLLLVLCFLYLCGFFLSHIHLL